MSDYRNGDVDSPLGTLRLSVGALAEIAARTGSASPRDLADRVRAMRPDTARIVLCALLRGRRDVANMIDAVVVAQMPLAARCIADALRVQEPDQ